MRHERRSPQARAGRRLLNASIKLRAGLTLFGENVSPEIPNDLFQAHLSLYQFFARFVPSRRVLDLGCGTGYGTAWLLQAGAREAVGIDVDRRALRYARRRFGRDRLLFVEADIERVPLELGVFDVIASSNAFEHVRDVTAAIANVRRHLEPQGTFLLAVPPIVGGSSFESMSASAITARIFTLPTGSACSGRPSGR